MKKLLLSLLMFSSVMLLTSPSSGQAPDWTRLLQVSTYGMQNVDAVTADAAYAYVAASISGQVRAGIDLLTSVGLRDLLLVKIANDQSVDWMKQYDAGAGGTLAAYAFQADASGNMYVTGLLSGTATFATGITVSSDASHNAFMVKFNPSGDPQWATAFLNTGSFAATKMAFDGDDNIYLISRSTKLIKFNSSGVIQWEQSYPNRTLQSVAVYGTNLYLGGVLLPGTTTFGTIPLTSLGGSFNGFLVKGDLDGVYSGSLVAGGSTSEDGSSITDIIMDNSGNLIITGSYSEDLVLGLVTVENDVTAEYNYTYIAKCDPDLAFSWAVSSTSYYNPGNEMLNFRLFGDLSGNIYEYGNITSNFNYDAVPVMPSGAPFMVKFNSSGTPQAAYSMPGSSINRTFISPAGLIFCGGSFSSPGNPMYGNFYITEFSNTMGMNWQLMTSESNSGTVQIRSVKHDGANNTYILARVAGYCNYFGEEINTTYSVTVISKHDINGDRLWSRQIGDIASEMFGQTFALDKDNNIIYTGLFQSSINIDYATLFASTAGNEGYIAKFRNDNGNLEWAHSADLGTPVGTKVTVATDGDDNIIFSGVSTPSNFLQKYSSDGTPLWSKVFPMDSEFMSLVSTDADNNIFMASEIHLSSSPISIGGIPLSQSSDDGATVLVKFDPDGNALWAYTYGGVTGAPEPDGWPTEIVNDANGNTYLWGWCLNYANFGSYTLNNPYTVNPVYSYYLTKIGPDGTVIWADGIYETAAYSMNYGDMLDLDEDGNIYAAGHFRTKIKIQGTDYFSSGTNDFFLLKFTNAGVFEWIKTIPSNGLICYSIDVSEEDVISVGGSAGKDAALGTFPYERKGGTTGIIGTLGTLGYLNVTASEPEFIDAAESSTCDFTISSNTSWTIECSETWLTPDITSGTGNATIILTASANSTSTYREAFVNVLRNGSLVNQVFVVQFGTPINSFPYTEDFTVYPSPDWKYSVSDLTWEHYSSSAVFANFWDNPAPARAELVSPMFDFSSLTNPEINFRWSHKYYSGCDDELRVEVYYEGASDWTTVWTRKGSDLDSRDGAQNEAPGTYMTTSINLSDYAGSSFLLVRFMGLSDYGPNLYIDQVVIYEGIKAAPDAVSGPAMYVYHDQAVMTGMVSPNSALTSITFEYGPTTSYGTTVNAVPASENGSVPVQAYYILTGLDLNSTYHYRIVAVNSEGTDYGDDVEFTTSGCERLEYTTANEAGTYNDLGTNGTVISTADYDNSNSAPYDIGFSFNYNCQDFTQFILNTNGFIKLGSAAPSGASLFFSGVNTNDGIFSSNNPADINILSPFTADLMAGTGSAEYRVSTSGISPDRVCTIQFKDVSDKAGIAATQYDKINFQIKLYETTNVIEFVYGTWTPSANPSSGRSSECGIKGSAPVSDHLITVSKTGSGDWNSTTFLHSNYAGTAFNFGNPPLRPAPDPGRTIRFTPKKNNDAAVIQVYTLTKLPIPVTGSHQVGAIVRNVGFNTLTDITVTLNISGANSFTDTYVLTSLDPDNSEYVIFDPFIPSSPGDNIVAVSVETDENNANNSRSVDQNVNSDTYSYFTEGYNSGALSYTGLTLSKFSMTGMRAITNVRIMISGNDASIGNNVYAVVTDGMGNIMGTSPLLTISASDLGKMHDFEISNPPVFNNCEFLAGLACTPPAGSAYYPIAFQNESPLRPNTFYFSGLSGGFLNPAGYRFMTEAIVSVTSLSISDNLLNIEQPANSTATFGITSNMGWNVTTGQSWLNISPTEGFRNATITLTAEENTTGSDRYAGVTVTGADGSSQNITVTQAGLSTGIEKTTKGFSVNLHPNPNKGKFTLGFSGIDYDKLRITITNTAGIVIKDMKMENQNGNNTHEIDMGEIPAGVYFISIKTETISTTKMFIIN